MIQRTAHSPHFSPSPIPAPYLRRRKTRPPSVQECVLQKGSGGHKDHNEISQKEQDRFLPIANVSRIMKKALTANAKISKDAKETVQECVPEFISFITGEASDKCQREKRKTINGDDLLWAMTTLGFEDYVEPLKIYLQRFRDMEGEKSALAGRGEKESGVSSGDGGGGGNGGAVNLGNSSGRYEGMYGMNIMGHQGGGPVYGYGQMVGGSGKVGSGYHHGPGSGGSGGWAR